MSGGVCDVVIRPVSCHTALAWPSPAHWLSIYCKCLGDNCMSSACQCHCDWVMAVVGRSCRVEM